MVSSPLLYFISVPLFAFFTEHTSWAAKSRLVIGGLAGLNVQGNGWCSAGIVPAVELALERVNNHSDILKDYHLDIEWKDAKVCQNVVFVYLLGNIYECGFCGNTS